MESAIRCDTIFGKLLATTQSQEHKECDLRHDCRKSLPFGITVVDNRTSVHKRKEAF